MQIAAFVAVVRPNISGKETRGCPPYGLSVRAVQEHFQVSGRRIAMEESVPHFLLTGGGGLLGQTTNRAMWENGVIDRRPLSFLAVL